MSPPPATAGDHLPYRTAQWRTADGERSEKQSVSSVIVKRAWAALLWFQTTPYWNPENFCLVSLDISTTRLTEKYRMLIAHRFQLITPDSVKLVSLIFWRALQSPTFIFFKT